MVSRVLISDPRNGLNQTALSDPPLQLSLRLLTKSEVNQQTDKASITHPDIEKRSQREKNADGCNVKCMFQQRVGGRHAISGHRPGGGGYLDICTTFQASLGRDPRLDTLRQMGLSHTWQRVAAMIGVDAFLAMWRILDAEERFHHDGDGLRFSLRRYRSFLRFERDQFICALAAAGLSTNNIQHRLADQFGECLSSKRIRLIIEDKTGPR